MPYVILGIMPGSNDQESSTTLLRPFYPSLDGLRAVAFLMVFLVHYGLVAWPHMPGLRWGWVGVDLFFVLSGFLITGILYDSVHRPDYFRNFYIRRALRVFPVFYGFWLLLLILTPIFHFGWNRYNISMVAYFGNFFLPKAHLGLHADPGTVTFSLPFHRGHLRLIEVSHFWSLCSEEQFYFVWPAVIWLVRSRRALLTICLAIVGAAPFLRILFLHLDPALLRSETLYYNTLARPDGLLLGAAVALWIRGSVPPPRARIIRSAYCVAAAAPLLFALCYRLVAVHGISASTDLLTVTFGYSFIAITAASLLLLALDSRSLVARLLHSRPLMALGRISYGMYFFHALPLYWFNHPRSAFASGLLVSLLPLLGFLFTYIVARFSFRYVESPMLRLKDRFAPRPGAIADPQPDPTSN